jgi:putative transposase
VFVEDRDYCYYLNNLKKFKEELGVKVYAWCLMTNHVHLILDPGPDAESIGVLMKYLAARQTRYVNKNERRTGSLWDGRYKASPIQADAYLLQCCRYVELNPLRAAMVAPVEDYPWSSYRAKAELEVSTILDKDPCYQKLRRPREQYRAFVEQGVSDRERAFIRTRVARNCLTGNEKFVEEVERRINLRVEYREPGRPPRSKT